MAKQSFIDNCSFHQYGKNNENGVKALFFDRTKNGYKFVVYSRASLTNKKELAKALKGLVFDDEETPLHINCAIAPTEVQRFKVPICASGLVGIVKH